MGDKPRFVGTDAVGKRVGVYWDGEECFYYGVVTRYNPKRERYQVKYDDGDEAWEREDALNFEAAEKVDTGQEAMSKPDKKRKRPRTPPGQAIDDDHDDTGSEKSKKKKKKKKKKKLKGLLSASLSSSSEAKKHKSEKKQLATALSSSSSSSSKLKQEKKLEKKKSKSKQSSSRPGSPLKQQPSSKKVKLEKTIAMKKSSSVSSTGSSGNSVPAKAKAKATSTATTTTTSLPKKPHKTTSTTTTKASNSTTDSGRQKPAKTKKLKLESGVAATGTSSVPTQSIVVSEASMRAKIGKRVKVYWPGNEQHFYGKVVNIEPTKKEYRVKYDDGETHWEKEITVVPDDEGHDLEDDDDENEEEEEEEEGTDGEEHVQEAQGLTKDTPEDVSDLKPCKSRGSDGVGWRVEFYDKKKKQRRTGEVICYNSGKSTSTVAVLKGSNTVVDSVEMNRKRYILLEYLSKPEVPLFRDCLTRADVDSLEQLGALARTEIDGIKSALQLLEDKKNPDSDILRVLLELGFPCDTTTFVSLIRASYSKFHDEDLMKAIIKRSELAKSLKGDIYSQLYNFLVEHVLRTNSERFDALDTIAIEILSGDHGFSYQLDTPISPGSSGSTSSMDRASTVVEGSPLVHALGRGNVGIGTRLMDVERDIRHSVSDSHWKNCKLGNHYENYNAEWNIGDALRLVLFFFVVAKSFNESHLKQLLKRLVKECKVDLDKPPLGHDQHALTFLCTITEKRLLTRVRMALLGLLEAGANPDAADRNGLTPLLACVRFRNSRNIKLLVNSGKANVQLHSPLLEACELGHQEEIGLLISCGATLSEEVFDKGKGFVSQLFQDKLDLLKQVVSNVKSEDKEIYLTRLLVDMCHNKESDVKYIKYLLNTGADPTLEVDGRNAMIVAVEEGRADILECLVNDDDAVDLSTIVERTTGQSLLVLAAGRRRGAFECVRVILEHGADVNAVSGHNFGHRNLAKNALIAAVESKNIALVNLLLGHKSTDVNHVTLAGWTALHLACSLDLPEVAKALIEHGADVHKTDSAGQTPMSWACVSGSTGVITVLAAKDSDTLRHVDNDGFGPLQLAIRNGHDRTAVTLVNAGANLPAMS